MNRELAAGFGASASRKSWFFLYLFSKGMENGEGVYFE